MEQTIQKCLDEIAALTQKVRELENIQADYSTTITELSNRSHTTPSNDRHAPSSQHVSSQVSQTADEVFEIAKRKLDLIIRGLPEKENDVEDFVTCAFC